MIIEGIAVKWAGKRYFCIKIHMLNVIYDATENLDKSY